MIFFSNLDLNSCILFYYLYFQVSNFCLCTFKFNILRELKKYYLGEIFYTFEKILKKITTDSVSQSPMCEIRGNSVCFMGLEKCEKA